jgi:hypothetical protein
MTAGAADSEMHPVEMMDRRQPAIQKHASSISAARMIQHLEAALYAPICQTHGLTLY